MKNLFFLLLLFPAFTNTQAQRLNQPYLLISLTTGGDDLRGGQSVKATIHFRNRGSMVDIDLNEGEGWANNTTQSHQIEAYNFKPTDLRAIGLTHDGNGRTAFEGYDNWNLDRIKVTFVSPGKQPRHTDAQLQSWGFASKLYQYSAWRTRPNDPNAIAVYRWTMPNCAGSIMFGEHELTDAQLQSWGYKDKEFQFYTYRQPPNYGQRYIAVYRWINAKPQSDPCRDFTLTVAETELTDAQLTSWGYTEKRLQFYVMP
jgi:hypothetical protein